MTNLEARQVVAQWAAIAPTDENPVPGQVWEARYICLANAVRDLRDEMKRMSVSHVADSELPEISPCRAQIKYAMGLAYDSAQSMIHQILTTHGGTTDDH